MSEERTWDIALNPREQDGKPVQFLTTIPLELGLALHERGLNRAKVRLTGEGILLVPYVAEVGRRGRVVELPDWNGA